MNRMAEQTSPVLPPDQRPPFAQLVPMPASRVSKRRPIIVGHRGAQGLAPENTLPAFEAAAALNIDGVEFDVQRTKDGHLIVFHDEDVARTTDGQGLVADLTLDEIQALDAGSTFGEAYRGVRVPTLRALFDYLTTTDLLLFIELKDPWRYPDMEAQVIELIRAYDLVQRSQIRSFYHAALHTVYQLAPEIALSELWWNRLPTNEEVIYNTINAYYPLYGASNIEEIHRRGQKATAWTVDDLDEARRLMAAGIDGLTTNYPDRLLALFEPGGSE
jgi:glycerophosphoryl diester phosphodiesterase